MSKKLKQESRRMITVLAALVTIALSAAGCSGGGTSSNSSKSTGDPSGAMTVWVGSWWQDQVPKIEAAWKEAHPEITLTIEPLPINGYPDKFTAAALGGDPPDIVDLDATMVSTAAAKNLLTPLDDVVKKVDVKDYAVGIWQSSQYKGVQYALPDRASSTIYYYNKTAFDKAGVAYPTNDWTYPEFLDTVKKLTIPGQYGVGLAADLSDPSNAMDFLAASVWGHGGSFINDEGTKSTINSPESVAGITYWTDLYTKYKVAPPGTPNFTTTRDLVPLFEANQVALVSSSSSSLAEFDKHPDLKYGTVMIPGQVNRSGGWTMAIPAGAKNPEAAKVFMLWFSDPKIMAEMMNRTPARISANAIPPWNDPKYAIFTKALEHSQALPSVSNWTEMQSEIITQVQKVLVGQVTPQQAADAAAAQMDAILARN